jgi:hypothetical protein
MLYWIVAALSGMMLCGAPVAWGQASFVRNGDFSQVDAAGVPDGWSSAGAPDIKQTLSRDVGPGGKGFSGRLVCTEFHEGTPSSHAMICQVGTVSVQKGKWYRLRLTARGEGIRGGVRVGLSNTNPWGSAGLAGSFSARAAWRTQEFMFQATMDLPAENSRLQVWYSSTGTLWLSDVSLTETDMRPQWHPQLPTEGRTNFIPNSSFECGAAGWGSYVPDLGYWYGNAFRLMGDVDDSTASHGSHSLRITLDDTTPTYYFDYYEPVRKRITALIAAHQGWVPVRPGDTYTLSASIKANTAGLTGVLFVRQAGGRNLRQNVALSDQWQRYTFSFTVQGEYLWTGIGLDLAPTKASAGTVWVDAVQLERSAAASAYQPAAPLEVMVDTATPGNSFASEAGKADIAVRICAFNNSVAPAAPKVSLAVTDFFDAEVIQRSAALEVAANSGASATVALPVNRLGFFRVVASGDGGQPLGQLRCMCFEPYRGTDSRFGMNHAYPWDAMLPFAHRAGILWWRDWTTQWRTVQPARDAAFDFTEVDHQINRVLSQNGKVLALFPFPSAEWSSAATPEAIDKVIRNPWERQRVPTAFAPTDEGLFAQFISRSVGHLGDRIEWFQFLNESLYTSYALPAAAGYKLDDYVRLLRIAREALKAERPSAKLVAGMGIWADNKYTRDFVEAGGLQFADVLDLHLYPAGDPEPYGESLGRLWARMNELGEARPVWVTELGCYGDDDPPVTPFAASFGDSAMRNALKDTERDAAEWLIKFATVVFANGGEKLFLHAGTCGEINGDSTGGVFFKFGAVPRKILPAVSVMANLLPPAAHFVGPEPLGEKLLAYRFSTPRGDVCVAWSEDGDDHPFEVPAGMKALDIMGNPLAEVERIGSTPIYLVQ